MLNLSLPIDKINNHIYFSNYLFIHRYTFINPKKYSILYINGKCPICHKYITCYFINNNDLYSEKYLIVRYDKSKNSEEMYDCLFFKHNLFMISHIIHETYYINSISIEYSFNTILPRFKSPITEFLFEKFAFIHCQESILNERTKLYNNKNIYYTDLWPYFQRRISWDNKIKCLLYLKFSNIMSEDVAMIIVNFVNWMI